MLPLQVCLIALMIALLLDECFGEPPAAIHPVIFMGKLLQRFSPWLKQSKSNLAAFLKGAFAWWLGVLLAGITAFCLQYLVLQLNTWLSALLLGILLTPLFAWRMLKKEVLAVELALQVSLEDGRKRLSYLVSRDTSKLDEAEIRESAIETLAENLNDSVIAPLFWFCLAGLPGAAIYRFANTADAMWGYRHEWEWAGKWAAYADDVLSWIPARITALLLLPTSLNALRQQARKTPSPNGGWTMGAMALRLGVCLTKPGVYQLNETGRQPVTTDLIRAVSLAQRAVWLGLIIVLLIGVFWWLYQSFSS